MSETNTEPVIKLSTSFERKVGLEDYGSKTASAWLTVEIPVGTTPDEINAKFGDLFSQLKASVYDELGIEVLLDEAGVLREKYNPAVQRSEGAGVQAARRELGATGGFNTGGLKVMNPDKLTEDVPQWVLDFCAEKGITAVWANTGKFGAFYKEAVSKGQEPIHFEFDSSTGEKKAAIIRQPK